MTAPKSPPGDRSDPIQLDPAALQRHLAASTAAPETRDDRIARAGATILACLGPDDQLEPDHQSVLDEPSSAVFAVLVPNWDRGRDLADRVDDALKAKGLTSWCKRTMQRRGDGVRVEISVAVGEAERAEAESCPHGSMPREAGAGHWRDWHRGHGCHLDPDRKPAGAP